MKPCDELFPLIAERASGALPVADEARVAAHLEGCGACRAQARHLAEVLTLARAPGPSALEEREAASLARRATAAARRPHRGARLRRLGLGLAAAATGAAAVVAVGVPLKVLRRPAPQVVQLAAADGSAALDDADAIAAAAWEISDDAESDVAETE